MSDHFASAPAPEPSRPVRHRPAHPPVVESADHAVIVFLTVCTHQRRACLANPATHTALLNAWHAAQNWRVGRYVLMPDHVHLFCAPGVWPPPPLRSWVAYWKRLATQALRETDPTFEWQRDHWDTQLRRGQSYGEKWNYVRMNPVRAGLVSTVEAWPYQGELHRLFWHD